MRRALLRSMMGRLGMACYAVWVALAFVTQSAMPCPTHDGPAAVAVMAAMMPSMAMDGSMAGAGDATHAPAASAASDASHTTQHGHLCTCVGCGCCVAALDLSSPSATHVPAPVVVARGTTAPLAPARVELPRVGRRLPFANAPPVMVNATV